MQVEGNKVWTGTGKLEPKLCDPSSNTLVGPWPSNEDVVSAGVDVLQW